MTSFARFIGIDYSGAATPTTPLQGIRVFESEPGVDPIEIRASSGASRHWSRRRLAEWIVRRILEGEPLLFGIDHGFSFPESYFRKYRLNGDWGQFLDDFSMHWPSDGDHQTVRALRPSNLRAGDSRDRRYVEILAKAKSVFHFDVPGSVATSTHAGLPWLRFIRRNVGRKAHFWPYDGLRVPEGASVIAEVYPALWFREGAPPKWTRDQWDAYLIAESLSLASASGVLDKWLEGPPKGLYPDQNSSEGWILGFEKMPRSLLSKTTP